MLLPQTACLGANGLPILLGFIDEYDEPPAVLSSMQADGTWESRHFDISSPVSVLGNGEEQLLLTGHGELLSASDGGQKFDFQELGMQPVGFSALRKVCGRLLTLSFNAPPVLSNETGDFSLVSGFSFNVPCAAPADAEATAAITHEELYSDLIWANDAVFFYDGVEVSPEEFVVVGSHGAVHSISKDGIRRITRQIVDRPEMHFTAAYAHSEMGLIVCGADSDTSIYQIGRSTGQFETLFEASGLASLVAMSSFLNSQYIANALPSQHGGGLESGLLRLSGGEVTTVGRFAEPVRTCFSSADALWVITDIRVSRFDGSHWIDFALPEYALPSEYG